MFSNADKIYIFIIITDSSFFFLPRWRNFILLEMMDDDDDFQVTILLHTRGCPYMTSQKI
jgi:hypothetical protein